MGSKMYILINTLLPCLSEQARLPASWTTWGVTLCVVCSVTTNCYLVTSGIICINIIAKICIDSQIMKWTNKWWCMVLASKWLWFVFFKSYHSLLGMWQRQPVQENVDLLHRNMYAETLGVHGLVKVAVIWCWQLSYHSLLWLVCDHCNNMLDLVSSDSVTLIAERVYLAVKLSVWFSSSVRANCLALYVLVCMNTLSQCWYVLASVMWMF